MFLESVAMWHYTIVAALLTLLPHIPAGAGDGLDIPTFVLERWNQCMRDDTPNTDKNG